MSLEMDCPYCGRAVGVVRRLNMGRARDAYKLAVHAVGAPTKARRPRCVHGSGLEVARSALREVPISAVTRKAQQRAAARARVAR